MHQKSFSRRLIAGCILGVSALACFKSAPTINGPTSSTSIGPKPGAHEYATCPLTDQRAHEVLRDSIYRWTTLSIPEYQDEQKFVTGNGREKYGPLACVVAAENVDKITLVQFTRTGGALVAIVYVNGGTLDAPYNRLNLSTGFNCVYLHLKTYTPGGTSSANVAYPAKILNQDWEAFVFPTTSGCTEIARGRPLPVIPIGVLEWSGDSVPAVSRFVVDSDWKPGIGVRCLSGWCTIGYGVSKLRIQPHPITSDDQLKHRLILGWFDDQELAFPNASGSGIHADKRASIIPYPGLDGFHISDFQDKWQPVATVHHVGPPAGRYADVTYWGFTDGSVMENLIQLKHTGTDRNVGWQVKIDGRENPINMRVVRNPHEPNHVVGTARWRWFDSDEAVWIRCDDGCCMVEPI